MTLHVVSTDPQMGFVTLVCQWIAMCDDVAYGVHRDVVERRVYTVTGTRPDEEDVERLIETGESETIFQKAILEQGRGQVR